MKKQGNVSDFIKQRDAEVRNRYFSHGSHESALYSTDHLLQRTVKSPSSRFWVDPDRARDVLSRYGRDPHALDRMLPGRRAMYMELYARYTGIQEAKPQASMIECVTEAVYSEAPEFFLSAQTARDIIFKKNRRNHRQNRQNLTAI